MSIVFLSKSEIEKISAGEIVGGPSSVVKELVENSLDANSNNIQIDLLNSMTLIRVKDDGDGIPEDQIEIAIQRYSTSKFKSLREMLFLGFRGEALFTIGSVSKMIIVSRTKFSDVATKLTVEFGEIKKKENIAANKGTTVEIYDLFENVPARKKFAETNSFEAQRVESVVKRLAIAYPSVAFGLSTGRRLIRYPSVSNNYERIIEILSSSVGLFCEKDENNEFSIECYLYNNSKIKPVGFVTINQRPVIMKQINNVVLSSLASSASKQMSYFVYIKTNVINTDVNVHPSKLTVRLMFLEEIQNSIKKIIHRIFESKSLLKIKNNSQHHSFQHSLEKEASQFAFCDNEEESQFSLGRFSYAERDTLGFGKVKTQLFDSVIITEKKDSIFMIDQHGAHERILFDKMQKTKIESQLLLSPDLIEINQEQKHFLEENVIYFNDLGIDFEIRDNFVMIFSVPNIINPIQNVGSFFFEIIDIIKSHHDAKDMIWKEVACRFSIKANKRLELQQMEEIINLLEKTNCHGFCNHGRNVYVQLEKKDLYNFFGRQ